MIDLSNQEIFQAMQAECEDAFGADDGRRAFIFIRNMAVALAAPENKSLEARPDMLETYQNLIDRLTFVALPNLKDAEAAEVFKNKILLGLREENINFVNKVKARLIAIPDFAARDAARKQLCDALLANEEQLGTGKITVGAGPAAPTLASWLKKYNERFGMVVVNAVARNQFFVSDPEVKFLNEADKKVLRRLLELYDYLKLSSQTPEGLEDPVLFDFDGQRKILRNGEFEDIVLPPDMEKMVDEIFKLYEAAQGNAVLAAAPSFDIINVAKIARSLLTETKGDTAVLRDALDKAINNQAKDQVLGILLFLAQLRRLDDVLADDARFRELVAADLKNSGAGDKVEGLRLNPTAPNFIARLLKVVLQEKLNLAEAEALGFSQKLSGLLALEGEKYSRIVVDDGKGGWKWNL